MSALPLDFILLLLGFCAGASVLALAVVLFRQHRIERLKDARRDHLRQDDDR